MTDIPRQPPVLIEYPVNYVMPLPPQRDSMDADEMQPVRVPTPLPDLLPRNLDDIRRLRELQKNAEHGRKPVAPRRALPAPYVNDDECDEFDDQTIDVTVRLLPETARLQGGTRYHLGGPSVAGEVSPVFDSGMLYKVVAADGTWYYYNDMDKYEMHVTLTFGAKSDVEPGERAEVYVMNTNELAASLVVYPGETVKLVSGKVNGFRCRAKAVPLSDEKREVLYGEVNDRIAAELDALAEAMGVVPEQLDEETVLRHCEQSDTAYMDCVFRPCDYSLYRPDTDTYMPRFLPWHRPATWLPDALQQREVRLFRRSIAPWHVAHGAIGDTYLLSAAAALAERPALVRDLFRHPVSALSGKSERTRGAYWVTLSINGWWLPVLLDDYLPATRDGPEFMRCACDVRRLWPALLEKAYAKVHGSYANIASGDPLEPLTELTGFPVTRYDAAWEGAKADAAASDSLWECIAAHDARDYVQMVCTPSDGGEAYGNANVVSANPELSARYARIGLRLHHGYVIVCAVHVREVDVRLLLVRNPWAAAAAAAAAGATAAAAAAAAGAGQNVPTWDGAWAKGDSRWTTYPAVREACAAAAAAAVARRRRGYAASIVGSADASETTQSGDADTAKKMQPQQHNGSDSNKTVKYASGDDDDDAVDGQYLHNAFWIEWHDALQLFIGGGCCHVHTPYYDYRIRGVFEHGIPSIALEVNVADPTTVYLMLTQEDERDADAQYEYQALLLSVFRQSGKKARLDVTSSTLVEQPNRQLKFTFAREVALQYTFVPEHCPYYVVPRMHEAGTGAASSALSAAAAAGGGGGASTLGGGGAAGASSSSKPYVLGFLCDTYVGNGIRVDFAKIDRNCKIFANMPSFVPQGMVDDAAAEYQIRGVRQPTECVGTALVDERLREFGIVEEM